MTLATLGWLVAAVVAYGALYLALRLEETDLELQAERETNAMLWRLLSHADAEGRRRLP